MQIAAMLIAIPITTIIITIIHYHIAIITAIKTCCFANSGKSARSDTPGPRAEPPKLIAHYNHDHNDYYDDTRTADIKRVKSIKVTTEPAR